jgi:hypothetical protein
VRRFYLVFYALLLFVVPAELFIVARRALSSNTLVMVDEVYLQYYCRLLKHKSDFDLLHDNLKVLKILFEALSSLL